MTGSINKNDLFSHGKDLLFALGRSRPSGRPLVFVAHSLGGILVKGMLASAAASPDGSLRNIVEATAAVVFLGTPHRGSPELASLGNWARGLVGTIGCDTNAAVLDALGLQTSDLERAQESFSALWHRYDFRVKTFQEGLGLTGVNLGVLGNKVVPDYSSLLGDAREQAETLQADHRSMCRFSGAGDPNYARVSGEIRSIYLSLASLQAGNRLPGHQPAGRSSPTAAFSRPSGVFANQHHPARHSRASQRTLRYLRYTGIDDRLRMIRRPADDTCQWLFEHPSYQAWFDGRDVDGRPRDGLLWVKGKPGSGKSTLLKHAFARAQGRQKDMDFRTAAFFFHAKGTEMEHSPAGLFRSLLYQLLRAYPEEDLEALAARLGWEGDEEGPSQPVDLTEFFVSLVTTASARRPTTILFIDALDECDADEIRSQAYFWRETTYRARVAGSELRVCLSSRHFPSITIVDCPEISVEHHNSGGITAYVENRLQLAVSHQPERQAIKDRILLKSAGVFLWVVLVLDGVLEKRDDGRGLRFLLEHLDNVPEELEALFSQTLAEGTHRSRGLTLRFFQWATLATKPLRLHEWKHILAFISEHRPSSLREWMESPDYIENEDQVERQIRAVSKGLVEVVSRPKETSIHESDDVSVHVNPGSLNLEVGETRVVQVIHDSVRTFFTNGRGFQILGGHDGLPPGLDDVKGAVGRAHLSIMETCLKYLDIKELDGLVQARIRSHKAPNLKRPRPRSSDGSNSSDGLPGSPASFGSAGSHHSRRRKRRNKAQSVPEPQGSFQPVFEQLRNSNRGEDQYLTRIDMYQADTGRTSVIDLHESPTRVAAKSPTVATTAGSQRLLECSPSLLSYAIFELFCHARLADELDADPTSLIEMLGRRWERWLALHEGLPLDTGLMYYAAGQSLTSWIRIALDPNKRSLSTVPSTVPAALDVQNAIREAVTKPNTGALERLLTCVKDNRHYYPLGDGGAFKTALQTGALWAVQLLYQHGLGNIWQDYSDGQTPLHMACSESGSWELVVWLLEQGAARDATDGRGRTPLHVACTNGLIGPTRALLRDPALAVEKGMNRGDHQGDTALHLACGSWIPDTIANELLLAGANPFVANNTGDTPLHLAAWGNRQLLVDELLTRRVQVMARNHRDEVALHHAAQGLNTEVLERLLRHEDQEIDPEDINGSTPLKLACVFSAGQGSLGSDSNGAQALKTLLRGGANPFVKNRQGTSVYDGRSTLPLELRELLKQNCNTPEDMDWLRN